MSAYRFFQIDAFAERPMAGGPAGVMPLDAFLPDETMLAIAFGSGTCHNLDIHKINMALIDPAFFSTAAGQPFHTLLLTTYSELESRQSW